MNLDGDIERLEALRDAVKRTSRKRMQERMVAVMLKGSNLKKGTAEMYVNTILRYRTHFEEALAEAVSFERQLQQQLDGMFAPPIKPARVKTTRSKSK